MTWPSIYSLFPRRHLRPEMPSVALIGPCYSALLGSFSYGNTDMSGLRTFSRKIGALKYADCKSTPKWRRQKRHSDADLSVK